MKFWLTHFDFHSLIKKWWEGYSEPKGSRMYALQQKFKHVIDFLKKWNKQSFRHILMEKGRLEDQIGELQSRLMSGGYNETERTMELGLIKELVQLEKQEELSWQQKFRQLWLKEGDRNMSFFHKSIIQNHQQNRITLRTQAGQVVEKQNELEQHLIQFYSELLHETNEERERDIVEITRHIPKLVTPEHNVMLIRIIECKEVEEAVIQMEKGKAPGPDGFTTDFFQSCWDLVKEEMWEVVEESRRMG